jgi:ferrous iron transport protein B
MFLREAGTVILGFTILLWALLSFPKDIQFTQDYEAQISAAATEAQVTELTAAQDGERLRGSYGGRLGHALEPVIQPLGFDWKIGVGLIGAFAAREVFVSTMGVVYGVGGDVNEESVTLRERMRSELRDDGKPVYTPLVGMSLMAFFALACQCMSTLAVVKRETGGWRWPAFLFVYMTSLAWTVSFIIYQGGRLLGFAG